MSKDTVEAIIGKAIVDAAFRQALLADPEKALAGYDLTTEEKAALRMLDSETLDSAGNSLDARISKWRGFIMP